MPRSTGGPAALLLVVFATVTPSSAQDASSAAAAGDDVIQDIVVTARRRSESLQKVPVAVSVVSGDQTAQENQDNLQDIAAIVPSAEFRTSSSNKDRTLFVRGVGTISTSPGVEPSVSTVVDGVVLARSGQATADVIGLSQLEVLRGPQGTLFGKNASAGVLNITTEAPSDQFHAWIDGGYFSGGGEYRAAFGAAGPITPELSGVFSALSTGFGGNVDNLYKDRSVNGYERNGFRGKLAWQPADDLRVELAADYLKSIDTVPNGVFSATRRQAYLTNAVTPNQALAARLSALGVAAGSDNRTIDNDFTSDAVDDNGGAALTADKRFGDYDLTSITAYRVWNNVQKQDYDQLAGFTAAFPSLRDRGTLGFQQFSQEVRLASPKGGLIDWVAGAYDELAIDDEIYQRGIERLVKGAGRFDSGQARYGTNGNNVAVFGEGDVNVTPEFRAILGARLVYDTLDFHFNRVSTSPVALTGIRPSFTSRGAVAHGDYAARAGLQYDVTPEVTAYFTFSRGYKGPAYNVFFNAQALDAGALKPETNDSYELGLKSSLLDRRLQLSLALFEEDFSDYQANFLDTVAGAIVTRLINAGAVSTRGFEADADARPAPGLTLSGALAYTDARIDRFNLPPGAAATANVDGQRLPFAPVWKLHARARQAVPLTERYEAAFSTDFSWQAKTQYQLNETPDTVQKPYGIWNGLIELTDVTSAWRLTLLLKNILDTRYSPYITYGNLGGVARYVPRDDRRYGGVELRKDF